MRVALVAPFGLRPRGTTSSRVLPIARELARAGATVRVVIPPWDDPERAGERWTQDGFAVVHTSAGGGIASPPSILREVVHRVQEFQPDVVHAFKPIGYSAAAASWLQHIGRTAQVVVDADDLEGPSGWGARRRLGLAGRIRGIQERWTLRNAPLLTVASAWLRSYVCRLGQPAERVRLVQNGYDPPPTGLGSTTEPRPAPADSGPAPGAPVTLLWYTRFTEARPDRAAALLAPLLSTPGSPRLTIIGEEVDRGDSRALAAALANRGVGDQIDWLGYTPTLLDRIATSQAGKLVGIYPLDDDLVNWARCPSKVPHLMALGIPVVGEAVGELASYLAGQREACLAPAGDAHGFRGRVRALLADPHQRARIGSELREAASQWTWERTARGLLDWYTASPAPPTQG
jgi:glycosyltransferase involved in cell wall biosynthesis